MGVPVTSTITVYPDGVYAAIDPIEGIDGWRSVANETARNAIVSGTPLRCRQGMAVWTQNDSSLWVLNAPPWAGTNADWTQFVTGGSGTVTTASVVTANGFAGTVASPTTTPAFTLETTVTGLLKGNGTAVSAATAGTDYVVPTVTSLPDLATVGTIASGVWEGSPITNSYLQYDTVTVAAGTGLTGGGAVALGGSETLSIASAGVGTAQLATSAVTYAKLQNESASTLLGNPTGSAAAPSEITLGSGLAFSGTTLVVSGAVTSVSNSDGSLAISPTTGAVVASLNVGHANDWSATQTFAANAVLNNTNYLLFNGGSDTNWRVGLGISAFSTALVGSGTSIQVVTGSGSSGPDGFAVGSTGANSSFEVDGHTNACYFRARSRWPLSGRVWPPSTARAISARRPPAWPTEAPARTV